jgi:hypothetical protein
MQNQTVRDDVVNAATVIPRQMSAASEIASGSGAQFIDGNILNIAKLSNIEAEQFCSEHQYSEKQPLYAIELEIWEIETEQLDWTVSELPYMSYKMIVCESSVLNETVVTGPAEFSWLAISELEERNVSVEDSQLPRHIFPILASILVEYYRDDIGTDDYEYDVIKPMLNSPDPIEAENELTSSVCQPLQVEFKKFIAPLKSKVLADIETKAKHPIWDPESVTIDENDSESVLSMCSWYSEYFANAFLTSVPTWDEPTQICIEVYKRIRNIFGTRTILEGTCFLDVVVDDSYSSDEQLLNTLFESNLLQMTLSENFPELFKSAL